MHKTRLDQAIYTQGLAPSRSQAENLIRLGQVQVNGKLVTKRGLFVADTDVISVTSGERYVSRAGLKLASVSQALGLSFAGITMLDVGSSTGGFTDYALQHGAERVLAVDVGTAQLHPTLRSNPKIALYEQTDIRDFVTDVAIDMVVIDVSFISLREILPAVGRLSGPSTRIVAMVKPQFEATAQSLKHKGVIKNDKMRRDILKDFELWVLSHGFVISQKADSAVAGTKGNVERFYLLTKAKFRPVGR